MKTWKKFKIITLSPSQLSAYIKSLSEISIGEKKLYTSKDIYA